VAVTTRDECSAEWGQHRDPTGDREVLHTCQEGNERPAEEETTPDRSRKAKERGTSD
jgi:hypothetical protein